MSTWNKVKDLPIEISGYGLVAHSEDVSSDMHRQTTVIQLHGGGLVGRGEDVVYDGVDHDAFQAAGEVHDLSGAATLGELSELVAALDLFPTKTPEREVSRLYRRWSFDSAALDLALRQAGRSLPDLLGREANDMSFVVSLRLGDPPSLDALNQRLSIQPGLRFKLDPTADWDDALIADLAATGAVESVDFKALYKGTTVDQVGDLGLYERVIGALPQAWVEDPDLEAPGVDDFLKPHRDRITWDALIQSVDDIERLPFKPRMVNVKPSRVGGLESLLDTYDYCEREGIGAYSGGQFELSVGRDQVQLMAAIFHPDSPNDLAPTGWNAKTPVGPLPGSPLPIKPVAAGFDLA